MLDAHLVKLYFSNLLHLRTGAPISRFTDEETVFDRMGSFGGEAVLQLNKVIPVVFDVRMLSMK